MIEFPHISESVLSIDIDSHNMSALWYVPGLPPGEQAFFSLPSPEASLVRRIRAAREARQDVYLHGTALGPSFAAEIFSHALAGHFVGMHPRLAAGLNLQPEDLERFKLTVSATCPPASLSIGCSDFAPDLWYSLRNILDLPEPAAVLVAVCDCGLPQEKLVEQAAGEVYAPESRFQTERCRQRFSEQTYGPRLEDFFFTDAPPHLLRLSAIQRKTGGPVTDTCGALVAAVRVDPDLGRRSWEEGILAIRATHSKLYAALVFRDHCCGILERRLPLRDEDVDLPALLTELDDFRMGRLTREHMFRRDGSVCALPELPPEAEGFRPVFVIGSRASLLRGHGRVCDDARAACVGMLHAYERLSAARASCDG